MEPMGEPERARPELRPEAQGAPGQEAAKAGQDQVIVAVIVVATLGIAYLGLTQHPKQAARPPEAATATAAQPAAPRPVQAQAGPGEAVRDELLPYAVSAPGATAPEPAVKPCTTGCAAKLDADFGSDSPLAVPQSWYRQSSQARGGFSPAPLAFPEQGSRSAQASDLPKQADCEQTPASALP